MQRHVPLHCFPPLAVGNELLGYEVPLLVFAALKLFVGVLAQVQRILEGPLVECGADRTLLLDAVAA